MAKPDQKNSQERRKQSRTRDDARERLVAKLPVIERRIQLSGVSTAVLEGGDGPSVVLLHGPGGHAISWLRVIPNLVTTHHVIAPDLPGQGASEALDGRFDTGRTIPWLGDLIQRTCTIPPVLVGHALGGAIAARFAGERSEQLSALVLVDTLGLAAFQPVPAFGQALGEFIKNPTDDSHDRLWSHCALDLDRMRNGMGEQWEWLKAYNLDRARSPDLQTIQHRLMEQFGMPAIPATDLARIAVPTGLIWGRHDRATPLSVAEAAHARFGWPLYVIELCGDDPPIEQPEAFLDALRITLSNLGRNAVANMQSRDTHGAWDNIA